VNMSSDPEQEYFADGMVEEIIASLSRVKWLLVIARNSSFVYKGKAVDVKQAARELGVRYVIEGSVRKAGHRVRITVQLVEADTGGHLWVERYDRQLGDIFTVQDEITLCVVGAIEPGLRKAEIERVKRKRPESLDAYDLVLRAMPFVHSHIAEDTSAALPLLEKALELEPDYPAVHASLALCYHSRYRAGLREEDRAAAVHHARAASTDAVDDATALGIAGFVVALDEHDQPSAIKLFDRALALSSSEIFTLWCSGIALAFMGQTEIAIERAQRALQLSPFDPFNFLAYNALAISYLHAQRYGEAYDAARRSIQLNPRFNVSHSFLVAALVGLSRVEDAKLAAQRLLELDPTFTIKRFAVIARIQPSVFEPFAVAWRLAGIPEA
jgi:TolB-like protein/Tfp pilus assembly protein PilF